MPSELQRHQQPKLKAASIPQLHMMYVANITFELLQVKLN